MADFYDDDQDILIEGLDKGQGEEKKEQAEQEKSEYEDVCFVCRRPESKAGKMFKLPNHICVCDDCMHIRNRVCFLFGLAFLHPTGCFFVFRGSNITPAPLQNNITPASP